MTTDPVLEVADGLYGLPLPEFTPARDARAKELKASAPELAAVVKALRKPSLAAWVVNLLVRREGEQVDQVLALGEALREAQAGMSGEELRALTRQRRQLTAAVTTRARAVAAELGVRVTQAVADQVEATLTAAMVDEGCARAVRSGQLLTHLAATGVDPVDLARSVAAPGALGFRARTVEPEAGEEDARHGMHVVPDPEADLKALRAAEEELAETEQVVAAAAEAHDAAARDVAELQARELEVQGRLDELRLRLAELETQMEQVEEELADAEDVRAEAESSLADATRERDAAQRAVERLRG